ncbi:MAG: hypothetical protein GTO33_09620, partial [Acidobacteria bacterium]|nr:hypothetical protein [Acidobacteriota bacterium]
EHESLVVIEVRPSDVHAALLLAGFEPGAPGRWHWRDEQLVFTPPRGDRVRIFVRYARGGELVEEPISDWITDARGAASFPSDPWVFGGSLMLENPPVMGPGEHYAADLEGSIIGLATFGDEVIGFAQVIAHDSTVQAPEWKVAVDRVPPVGTKVTLVIRAANE